MAIRVLVVDDSALMRRAISDILKIDKDIEVIGVAHNGAEALDLIGKLNPDVITMDINMPEMDGLTALSKIMATRPMPVVMVTSQPSKDSEVIIRALEIGAVDFVLKPSILDDQVAKEIISKIKTAALANIARPHESKVIKNPFIGAQKKLVVIGSSTGGPQTLEKIIPALPKNIPACVLVVQHMPATFTKSLAERLARLSEVTVKEAQEGDRIMNGVVYIAPGDYHMEVAATTIGGETREYITLNHNDRELGVRPCVNVLMRSVAKIYKEKVIAVILTGMGTDGTLGAKEIKMQGGTVMAQDEKSCIIYGMPRSLVESGYYDEIVELKNIPSALVQLLEI